MVGGVVAQGVGIREVNNFKGVIMKKSEVEEIIEEARERPQLKVLTGGRDGGSDFKNPNWLYDLPVGSAFIVQDKQANTIREDRYFGLQQLILAHRSPNKRGVLLLDNLNGQNKVFYVESMRFCSRWECIDILHFGDGRDLFKMGVEDTEEQEQEAPEGDTEDGNSERPVQ